MKKNRFVGRWATFFLIATLFSATVISCKENSEDRVKPKTIADVILENGQFSILKDIMVRARMTDALRTDNITLFAPDNNAFGRANIFSSSVIPDDSVKYFLQNHIIKNRTEAAELKLGNHPALNKANLVVTKTDSIVAVNKSDVVIPNVNADNGVIHVIDSVLVIIK
ncbi:fasciclin domain-containing protein [Dyadobacter sp. CY343]|uniref:fasciclin domain-containing protein n=1 Tax=Dyadobacter sp. CY343 TaxID=2907299 RepID=UPI001F2D233C|nr:fasciclin domain-containing protein [Dyadobacter sp. CY343]MCE7061768.1 fasciclin domain-containing protein [Dyadobacter sp. CY343]